MTAFRSVCLVVCAFAVLSGMAINANPSHKVAPKTGVSAPGFKARDSKTTDTKSTDAKSAEAVKTPVVDTTPAQPVSAIDLVKQPEDFLNKKVSFKATFNSFASLGLDYKKAFRDSKDYVSVLVLRPDVNPKFRIPLSELKLFFPRKKSDVVMHLDAGDTVQITGQVFSTALGEPWMDIDNLVITEKTTRVDPHKADLKKESPEEKKPLIKTPVKP